jgi:hypothetical protein
VRPLATRSLWGQTMGAASALAAALLTHCLGLEKVWRRTQDQANQIAGGANGWAARGRLDHGDFRGLWVVLAAAGAILSDRWRGLSAAGSGTGESPISTQRSVVFAEPVRTAIGGFGGALKDMPAPHLGASVIKAAIARAGIGPEAVETVVMGNVVQAGVKMNPARQASIHAGLPVTTPALTVNRVCGSGAQAIVSASQDILLGNIDVAVAGGMENMDLAPYLVAHGRWGYRMGDGQLYDSVLRDGLNDAFSDQASGWHTEDLVEAYQVSRDAQDRWALRSQQRFAAAQSAGKFAAEIVAVDAPGRKGPTSVDQDDANRPTRPWMGWPASSRHSARTGPSPPAMRPASTPAPRRWCSPTRAGRLSMTSTRPPAWSPGA